MKAKKKWILLLLFVSILLIGISVYANNSFKLNVSLDTKNNAVDLSWNVPDNKEPYVYKVYQRKEESNEFQSISTANLKDQVRVLNVYPGVGGIISYKTWKGENKTIEKSGSLEMWMESPNNEHPKGYGMGLIEVDNVKLADFNSSPEQYLKTSNGDWRYDTIFFGSWDNNGYSDSRSDLSKKSRDVIEEFIKSGRGVLLGHDTLHGSITRTPNFSTLRHYANIKLKDRDKLQSELNFVGSDDIAIRKRGLLTEYPWNIGDVGTQLKIPYTHSTNQIALGDIWMDFVDIENGQNSNWRGPIVSDPHTGKGSNNFYLTTWNNTAMIQTGHSNGAATPDEQKVLANTLFYLSQLTKDTNAKDRSGMDVSPPNTPKIKSYSNKTNTLTLEKTHDNGTTYEYYVEALGQDTNTVKKTGIKKITNTSGIAGYSYVVDNKSNTVPDNKIDVIGETFKLDLSKATGDMLHIAAIDHAGNMSEVTHFKLDLLLLNGSVDNNNNAIDLEWNKMPDGSQPYTYKVYQRKEGDSEFQSVSTADLKNKVKVLNVYPPTSTMISYQTFDGTSRTLPKSASVEMWMETPNNEHPKGYGMGLIDVEPVALADFNNNPNHYLKDSKGDWKYDVVYFGAWDCNGTCGLGGDLVQESVDTMIEYINSGRGVLIGHDTILGDAKYHPHFSQLRSYLNVKLGNYDYPFNITHIRSDKVIINKKGLLTKIPWDIGDVGTVLNVPLSHSTNEIAFGDIWMVYDTNQIETKDPSTGKGTNNFYLTTWNNFAKIQTGHSNGEATPDEQKVLANTLFYLSQLTTDTYIKDRSGMDLKPPTKPTNIRISAQNQKLNVKFNSSVDQGSTYEYYVESTGQNDGRVFRSNTIKLTNTSGLKGYSYVIDDNESTIPDNMVETTTNSFSIDLSNLTGKYLHLAAVDNAGNISEVIHYKLDETPPTFDIEFNPSGWTKKGVTIKVFNIKDEVSGYSHTILPNGQKSTSSEIKYYVESNGEYTFIVYDKIGNYSKEKIIIDKIDKGQPTVKITERERNQDRVHLRLEYTDK